MRFVTALRQLSPDLLILALFYHLFAGPEHIQEWVDPENILDTSADKPEDVVEWLIAGDGSALLGQCKEEDGVDEVVDRVNHEGVGTDVQLTHSFVLLEDVHGSLVLCLWLIVLNLLADVEDGDEEHDLDGESEHAKEDV